MLQPILTVIEGGNPDDQFSKTETSQLQLIQPDRRTAEVPTFTRDRPVILRMIDAIIGQLMVLREYLESRGQHQRAEQPELHWFFGGKAGW